MDILALLIGGSPAGIGSSLLLSHLGVYSLLFEGQERTPAYRPRERAAGPKEER